MLGLVSSQGLLSFFLEGIPTTTRASPPTRSIDPNPLVATFVSALTFWPVSATACWMPVYASPPLMFDCCYDKYFLKCEL